MGKTNRVGDAMIIEMRAVGVFCACTADGIMADVGTDLQLPLHKGMNPHPLNYARLTANYLERDHRFERGLMHGMDINGRSRILRTFRLKPDYQSALIDSPP